MSDLKRNDPHKELIPNGKRRHGQFEWHDANCMVEDYGISSSSPFSPLRYLWCATHGQWAHETPVKLVYTFEDGTEVKYEK